jgi:hypothetical protein
MKTITKTILQASVIAGAALGLTAMSTMPTAGRAYAQDMSEPSASADAESPDALPINVEGSWCGSIIDKDLGAGDINLSIMQTNREIKGGWSATFTSLSVLGDFKGHVTSKGATLELSSADFQKKDCKFKFKATDISADGISGKYTYAGCGEQFKGDKGGTIMLTTSDCTM